MPGVPTYVIGVGGVGCEVISRLWTHDQTDDSFGFLAIDSDPAALEKIPSEIPTVELTSDSGFVDGPTQSYPYLSTDDRVPTGDANGQRHIGRYKLDNPFGTPFQNHHQTIERRITQFCKVHEIGLTNGNSRRYHFVIVAALGGGTGSSIIPLLVAVLDGIRADLERKDSLDVRVFGVGIVPPIELDAMSVPPVSYPNAYGTFRNLSTLFNATADEPVEIPVYSQTTEVVGDQIEADGQHINNSYKKFELTQNPFDAYWLVGMNHGQTTDWGDENEQTVPTTVAGAIRALSECVAPDRDHRFQSRLSEIPTLGALGYGAVTVPHDALRNYCERREERDRLKWRLERVVERNIKELEDERADLRRALKREYNDDEWFDWLREYLDTVPEEPADLIDSPPEELEEGLEAIAREDDLSTSLATAAGLANKIVDDGLCSDIRDSVEETCRDIRKRYALDLAFGWDRESQSTSDRVESIKDEVEELIQARQESLQDTDPAIKDLLPPVTDAFLSDREQIQLSLERLQTDLEQLETAKERIRMVNRIEEVVKEQETQARERIRARLEHINRDLGYFRQERADICTTLDELDRDIAALRQSLTNPSRTGPMFVCPLRGEKLSELTINDVETELTSFAAYREHELLALDGESFEQILSDCHQYSRSWPASISRYNQSVSPATHHELNIVLYHPENESCVTDLLESITEPDTLRHSKQSPFKYTANPFRIEFVSVTHAGQPEALRGFERLEDMKTEGKFEALGHPYNDPLRSLAFPEWYDDISERFD